MRVYQFHHIPVADAGIIPHFSLSATVDFGGSVTDSSVYKTTREIMTQHHTPDPASGNIPMMPGAFDLFKPSIQLIKNNLNAFLLLFGVPFLLTIIGSAESMFNPGAQKSLLGGGNETLELIGLIGLIASILTGPGVYLLSLRGARAEKDQPAGETFRKGLTYFWKLLGLGICMAVLLGVSLLLFIVPFFIVLPKVFMAPYLLVDKNLGIGEALRQSFALSKGNVGAIYGVIGVFVLISLASIVPILGGIATAVGAFLYSNAATFRYYHLLAQKDGKHPITPLEAELAKAA